MESNFFIGLVNALAAINKQFLLSAYESFERSAKIMGRILPVTLAAIATIVAISALNVDILPKEIRDIIQKADPTASVIAILVVVTTIVVFIGLINYLGADSIHSVKEKREEKEFTESTKEFEEIFDRIQREPDGNKYPKFEQRETLFYKDLVADILINRSKHEEKKKYSYADEMILRLESEIDRQNRRSNTNLAIGIIFSFIGICLLSWLAYETYYQFSYFGHTKSDAVTNYLMYWGAFCSKLILAFSVSIFSFFFLSTYRRTLVEIKYFHNELTNIQSRMISVTNTDPENLLETKAFTLKALAKTERNFIIKKGETTAEIRTKEIDFAEVNLALMNLKEILVSYKKNSEENGE